MQKCLMLGAGTAVPMRRFAAPTSAPQEETDWVTLDENLAGKPQVHFDLNTLERGFKLPFEDDSFDEIHAYEVLEHFGRQGDYRGLFNTFRSLWRALKPGGVLFGTCPSMESKWLWVEPGHTRAIGHGTLVFLTKEHYDQLGKTACSDYRKFVDPFWWEIIHSDDDDSNFVFGLKRIE